MSALPFALIAEDDPDMASLLAEIAAECGFHAGSAATGSEALQRLQQGEVDLLLTDLRLPPPDGLALLRAALRLDPELPVVLITGHATVGSTVDAFRTGAFDLITKPFETEQVRAVLRRIRTLIEHRTRIDRLTTRLAQLDDGVVAPVMESGAMHRVLDLVQKVAPLEVPVLLLGETGTGKGVMARLIHRMSPRDSGPFFSLNCAAVNASLLESELFGHEKGAFTGATKTRRGLLELADGGTLLLDEINSAGPEVQSRLLQFIQERTLLRVGGERAIDVDVRLICAGNQPLEQLVKEARFRQDLYYRLNVYPVELPPLRERRDDIVPLAESFLLKYARELDKPARNFSEQALARLTTYDWPGNVRELENVIQRAVVLAPSETIGPQHLPADLQPRQHGHAGDRAWPIAPDATLAEVERFWIQQMLENCQGNKSEAARRLGIDPSTLYRKLKT